MSLFRKNGTAIASSLLAASEYLIPKPLLDAGELFRAYVNAKLCFRRNFEEPIMSFEEFGFRVAEGIEEVKNNLELQDLLLGPYFPILLPHMRANADFGKVMEQYILYAGMNYREEFTDRTFRNLLESKLSGHVTVVDSGHERLLITMVNSRFGLVGLYFPFSFPGTSIIKQRQFLSQIKSSKVSLCGIVEPAMALIMYPYIAVYGKKTPSLDCSAIRLGSKFDASCHFEFFAQNMVFSHCYRGDLFFVNASGGLLFIP